MLRLHTIRTFGLGLLFSITALGDVLVNTGLPDGLMGALSRQGSGGLVETETADDFLLNFQRRGLRESGSRTTWFTGLELVLGGGYN